MEENHAAALKIAPLGLIVSKDYWMPAKTNADHISDAMKERNTVHEMSGQAKSSTHKIDLLAQQIKSLESSISCIPAVRLKPYTNASLLAGLGRDVGGRCV